MSDDALRPVGHSRLHEQVVDRIRDYVREEGTAVGDRLPPERELAARLGVSRVSVKQALLLLEAQGAIETRRGGGSYLRREGAAGSESLARLAARRGRLPEALETRHALEAKLAQLAAVRRTASDLTAMEEALADMERAVTEDTSPDEPVRRFHEAVYAAAHNTLLRTLMEQIAPYVREIREESLRQPDRPSRSLAEHRAVLAAIRDADPAAAVAATEAHMLTLATVRLLEWNPAGGTDDHPPAVITPLAGPAPS